MSVAEGGVGAESCVQDRTPHTHTHTEQEKGHTGLSLCSVSHGIKLVVWSTLSRSLLRNLQQYLAQSQG